MTRLVQTGSFGKESCIRGYAAPFEDVRPDRLIAQHHFSPPLVQDAANFEMIH